VFDDFNDSALSDLKNDLDSARKMPALSDEKERMLSDIQYKL